MIVCILPFLFSLSLFLSLRNKISKYLIKRVMKKLSLYFITAHSSVNVKCIIKKNHLSMRRLSMLVFS